MLLLLKMLLLTSCSNSEMKYVVVMDLQSQLEVQKISQFALM